MKIGDNVRFLNAVGGGKIVKIDTKTNIVHVEDEDGFEIPVLMRECVVVNMVNANNVPQEEKPLKQSMSTTTPVVDKFVPAVEVEPRPSVVYETPEGEMLQLLLAFIPLKIKELQTSDYNCVLINDSNYFLYYNLVSLDGGTAYSIANGALEPNTQETILQLSKNDLNKWENIRVQAIPYKQQKTYTVQNTLNVDIHINLVKFYKLHSFATNDYFDEEAMIINITEEQQRELMTQISVDEIRQATRHKEPVKKEHRQPKTKQPEVLEIDLHINQLLDTTAGMSNADMLAYQMDVFHKTLAEQAKYRGKKIVFIHGKGEGVLRKEIEKALKNRYPNYSFQDASFREYGFGATMVTIR